MPMRICSVCHKLTNGPAVHPECEAPPAYRSLMHKRMSAVYRINDAPCADCRTRQADREPHNVITAHHVEPLARRARPRADRPEDYEPLCLVCNARRGSRVGTE